MFSSLCRFSKRNNLTRKLHKSRDYQSEFYTNVKEGPPDAILGLTEAFKKDDHPKKVNVGVGAYRDDEGKPFILPSVRQAESAIFHSHYNHEYAPISGLPDYNKSASRLLFGTELDAVKEGRIFTSQSISGTGALRIAGEFINRFFNTKTIYLPNPTWGNHVPIFRDSGLETKTYHYLDFSNSSLDFNGLKGSLNSIPDKSVVLFHACAHNPTGVDPTKPQWDELSQLCLKKKHYILFDCAYQGFASGDPSNDAYAVRKFISDGHTPIVCQSFAKNFGLYGERAGAIHVVVNDPRERSAIESQIKILIRPMYSNPPIFGARVVSTILNDDTLREQWLKDVKSMADRIIHMRKLLVDELINAGSIRDWSHLTTQIGMFAFTGIPKDACHSLIYQHHIYLTSDGRISISGVTTKNAKYIAECIHQVTK